MGAALGLLFGVGASYAGAQLKKKRDQDDQFLQLTYQHPELIENPAVQKEIKRINPHSADLLMAIHQSRQQAAQSVPAEFGGPAQPGAPSSAPANAQLIQASAGGGAGGGGGGAPPAAVSPTDPAAMVADLKQKVEHGYQFIGSEHFRQLDPQTQQFIQKRLQNYEKQLDQIQGQVTSAQLKTQDELAREKRAPEVESEKTKARVAAETSPAAIAGASKKSAAEAAAGESARLGVELSPKFIKAAADKAVAIENAKAKDASSKPLTAKEQETIKNQIATRAKNLLTTYEQTNPKPTLFGKEEWMHKRDEYIVKQDPEVAKVLGYKYGHSPTLGTGWVTPSGFFIPDTTAPAKSPVTTTAAAG